MQSNTLNVGMLLVAGSIAIAPAAAKAEATASPECGLNAELIEPLSVRTAADRLARLRERYNPALAHHVAALALAAQETAIGIRSDQKDAWRTYANAVLALVPEKKALINILGDQNEDPEGPPAFGRAEAIANAILDRQAKARALKTAIAELRAQLTSKQREAARLPRLLAYR